MERPAQATHRARCLRRDMTETERWLWSKLRNRRLGGCKFVRQMPVGPFFADFACREVRLTVELDGSQHADSAHDFRRDGYLSNQGSRVLRFWNQEVCGDLSIVCETILAALDERLEPYDRYKVP